MSNKIPLVQGDNLPRVTLTLKDKDGVLYDLTGCTGAVLYFKARGSKDVPTTIPCTVDIPNSKVSFEFPDGVLDRPAGEYVGEVELDFSGKTLTVYEMTTFKLREQFA